MSKLWLSLGLISLLAAIGIILDQIFTCMYILLDKMDRINKKWNI